MFRVLLWIFLPLVLLGGAAAALIAWRRSRSKGPSANAVQQQQAPPASPLPKPAAVTPPDVSTVQQVAGAIQLAAGAVGAFSSIWGAFSGGGDFDVVAGDA